MGRNGGPRRRPIRTTRDGACSSVDRATAATVEVGPRDAQRLGVRPARRRWRGGARLRRSSERGWYHTQRGADRFRDARGQGPARSEWQLHGPVSFAFGQARRLPRRLVERPRPGRRARCGSSISPPASVDVARAAGASNITSLSMARRGEPVVRRLVEARLDLRRGADRRHRSTGSTLRRRHHRPEQLSRRRSRPRRTRTASPRVRETAGAPPEIVFKSAPEADWQPVTTLNGAIIGGVHRLSRGARACAGRARTAWSWRRSSCCRGTAIRARCPTIVDIHGGPSWAAKHAFNPGYALHDAAAGYAVFLPNYRGNTGWGQEFARLNIGDPGGAEFERHPGRHRPLRRRRLRRSRPARRHRRQLRRLHDGLGGRDAPTASRPRSWSPASPTS